MLSYAAVVRKCKAGAMQSSGVLGSATNKTPLDAAVVRKRKAGAMGSGISESFAAVVKKPRAGASGVLGTNNIGKCACQNYMALADIFSIPASDIDNHPPTVTLSGHIDLVDKQLGAGLTTFSIQGDGNCLFRAVSKFLFGHESFHPQIRASIVQFMNQNSDLFSSYVDTLPFNEYLENMSQTNGSRQSWGSHTELFALATMLQCNLYIFSEYGSTLTWNRFFPLCVAHHSSVLHTVPYILLSNISGNHYETVRHHNSACICHIPPPILAHENKPEHMVVNVDLEDEVCCSNYDKIRHSDSDRDSHTLDHTYFLPSTLPSSPPTFTNAYELDHTYFLPSTLPSSPPTFTHAHDLDHTYSSYSPPVSVTVKQSIAFNGNTDADEHIHTVEIDHSDSLPLNPTKNMSSYVCHDHTYSVSGLPDEHHDNSSYPLTISTSFTTEITKSPNVVCFSCKKLFYPASSIKSFHVDTNPNIALLLHPLLVTSTDQCHKLCSPCFNSMKNKKKIAPQCILNSLELCTIPSELQSLNAIEERLISQVHAYMKLIVLPYGQQAINGQMINFPYDIDEILTTKKDDTKFLIVTTERNSDIPKEFIASMDRVQVALSWLQKNNCLYKSFKLPESNSNLQPSVICMSQSEDKISSTENDCTSEVDLTESSVCLEDPIMSKINFQDIYPPKSKPNNSNSKSFTLPLNTKNPLNIYSDTTLEQRAFPLLFPDGRNGLLTPRKYPLTHLKYFQARLMSVDRRFSAHLPYVFWATNVHEKKTLSDSISIAMRIRSSKSTHRQSNLTVNDVFNDIGSNPDLPENYYGFMRNIRGSGAYWNSIQLDLMSMIKNFGPPTWFLTLSANDMNWHDLMQVLCGVNGLPNTLEDVKSMSKSAKVKLMNSDPITTARHFSRRFHHFVQKIILASACPIGKVEKYFWRVEFQMRGSPHIHSLWWVENAPDINTEVGRCALPDFIDQYVSVKIPNEEEDPQLRKRVLALQSHKHTHTCKKYLKGKEKCRFGFPQPPSKSTIIKSCAELAKSSKCYSIKRSPGEEFINPYNSVLLYEWNANMDIQFVGGVYGAAKYICSYVCKRESDQIRQALSEVRQNLGQDTSMTQKLMKIGNVFLTHRQLSAQEAAYKMCGLPLKGASNQVVYLDSRPKDLRSHVLLPAAALNQLDPECSEIFIPSVHDRYVNRPHDDNFDNMTLFEFTRMYTKCDAKEDGSSKNAIPLENGMGYIKKRASPLVIRSNKTTPELHGDLHYLNKLILYIPWRSEDDLTQGYTSAKEAFDAQSPSVSLTDSEFGEQIEMAVKEVQSMNDYVVNNYIAPVVAPNIESVDNDLELPFGNTNLNSVLEIDSNVICEAENLISDGVDHHAVLDVVTNYLQGFEEGQEMVMLKSTRMTDMQFDNLKRTLNSQQCVALNFVDNYYAKLLLFKQGSCPSAPDPIHLFISGAGGTGKSYLISAICELIRRRCPVDDGSCVITTAPTGVAAFNINGITIHRALGLPVEHGTKGKFKPLTAQRLKAMRHFWKHASTLIIDEISMVSYKVVMQIHLRLNEIKGITDPNIFFGGLNIVAVGDLYQLPPVHGCNIFVQNNTMCGTHLWKDLFHMIELTEVVRQKDDSFVSLLNRVRIGQVIDRDLETLLKRVTNVTSTNPNDPSMLYLFPTVKQCDIHNAKMLASLSSYVPVYKIEAFDALVSVDRQGQYSVMSRKVDRSFIPKDDRECAGLASSLSLAVGSVVMLRRNINTSKGLVNGARGIITGFHWKQKQTPSQVIVKFFDESVADSAESVPIETITAIFYGKKNTVIQRTQFPLSLSWACTIHKVQGLTLTSAVIDLGEKVFSCGMCYVALGRVKTLDGICLLDFLPKSIKACPSVHEEMKRLREKNVAAMVEE